jgi:hypothetical protein
MKFAKFSLAYWLDVPPPIIAFSQREPQTYQALMQSLTPNDQAKFQELIKRAEARRVELAEEKRLEEEDAAKKRK